MNKIKLAIIILFLGVASLGGFYIYQQSQLQFTETLIGIGQPARAGQTAIFDYRAFLYDPTAQGELGKEFDSTYRRKTPMRAVIGAKQVIPGLDKALVGMKPGGQRRVIIGSSMAYGDTGAGDGIVPPNAKLVYQIELRSIE